MSNQSGKNEGLTAYAAGQMAVGEHAWHSVNAAIFAIEKGNHLQGLMLLRTLRFALAKATGHDVPQFIKGEAGGS